MKNFLSTLRNKLLPCDVNSPYVFVSYSSKDCEIVWNDVVELQSRGYNLWIDEPNIDKSKDSWEEDALKAIDSSNCLLLVFYVSNNSLTSKDCLKEIERTCSEEAIKTHFKKVDYVAIDCEKIGNIGDYIQSLYKQLLNSETETGKKDELITILYEFKTSWFPPDNKKVRIHSKLEQANDIDYYEDIKKVFHRLDRTIGYRPGRLYRFAIDYLIKGNLKCAISLLAIGADKNMHSALLLAHFLRTLPEYKNEERSEQLWDSVGNSIQSTEWGKRGEEEECKKHYSEAIAWLLAYGEKYNEPEYLYKASKNWVRKGCKEQTISVLNIAASMGHNKASYYLPKLQMLSTEDFFKKASTDEVLP